MRKFFATFGLQEELSSDGGPEFASSVTAEFFRTCNVKYRISSAYHPRSNGRAEVAVKSAKLLLRCNIDSSDRLDNDRLLGAMLQQWNTPDPDRKLSPAEMVFGRPLRDSFVYLNRLEKKSKKRNRKYLRDYTPATIMVCSSATSWSTAPKLSLAPPSGTVDEVPESNGELHKPMIDCPLQSTSIGEAYDVAGGLSEPDNNPVNINVQASLALRRLKDFNHPGLKESDEPVNLLRRR